MLGASKPLQRAHHTKSMGAPICSSHQQSSRSQPVLWLSIIWLDGATRQRSGVTSHQRCSGILSIAGDGHCNLGASSTLTESDTTGRHRTWKSCAMMSRFCLRQPRCEPPSSQSKLQGAPSSRRPREEAPGGTAAPLPMQPRRSTAWPRGTLSWWTAWRRCRRCGATFSRRTWRHPCRALPTTQMLLVASRCRRSVITFGWQSPPPRAQAETCLPLCLCLLADSFVSARLSVQRERKLTCLTRHIGSQLRG